MNIQSQSLCKLRLRDKKSGKNIIILASLLSFLLKGEFHVSAHGQTVKSVHLIPLLLKQSKALMQETETIPW